ncbi:MAG: GNAT family N-acetyltransferase [Anaerolineae bacterium]|nr:GNAT family N-acetyltransferase [Anaerolineae bacterium]
MHARDAGPKHSPRTRRPRAALQDRRAAGDQPLLGWLGKPHDHGFIAEDSATGRPLGVIWLRLFAGHERGYGYVDDHTCEVCTMCVDMPHRGRGVGTALMSALLTYVDAHYISISLSCDPRNPALRLYERFGFLVTGESGTSYTLLRTRSMRSS